MNYEEFMEKLNRGILKYNGILNNQYEWYNKEFCERERISFTTLLYGILNSDSNKSYEEVRQMLTNEIRFSREFLKTKPIKNIHISQKHVPDENGNWLMGYQTDANGRITFETDNGLFLIISKNPIDITYATSDQPYASCYKSQNSYNFYESFVRAAVASKNVWISFITDGTKRVSENNDSFIGTYEGENINLHQEHYIYKGRAWVYVSDTGDKLMVGRPYGKYGYELRDAIRRWSPNGLSTFRIKNKNFYQTYDNTSGYDIVFDNYNEISNKSLLVNENPFKKGK